MRAIEQKISDAVLSGCNFSGQNTVVTTNNGKTECILHGHKIFQLDRTTGKFKWRDCGWNTRTTSSRLNACFEAVHGLTGKKYNYSFGNRCVVRTDVKPQQCIDCCSDF